MCNKNIRKTVKEYGLKYWQLAKEIGISASTLCVWMRDELEGERLEQVEKAIEKLKQEEARCEH